MNKKIIAIFLILVVLSYITPTQTTIAKETNLDGLLLKGQGPEVFLIKFQKRHWIKTPEIFSALGFKWKDIIELSDQAINQYALGMIIALPNDLNKLNEEKIGGENKEESSESKIPLISVGIYGKQNGELFQITANGPYEVYKNNQFLSINNKEKVFETIINHQVSFKFIPKTQDTIFEIKDYKFRGIIELKYSPKSKLVWVINELDLEDYLKGVAEPLDTYPEECLKSLAIAARSYAFFHIQNKGKYPGEIFHLRNWAYDQVYEGHGFELQAPNVVKAIKETKGLIAVYPPAGEAGNNRPIRGVYSSDSGGTTRDSCEAWGNIFCEEEYNYLRGGIQDPAGTKHTASAIRNSHGIGISAVGAEQLAKLGKDYEEILKYYYQGIKIEKIY